MGAPVVTLNLVEIVVAHPLCVRQQLPTIVDAVVFVHPTGRPDITFQLLSEQFDQLILVQAFDTIDQGLVFVRLDAVAHHEL